ncbi:MAG TPA: hypothetical protein VG845_13865 [Dehalococcoidia bacterium]|nr:hypothetical protein [Dehalococcoidia bacterium]
MCCRTSVYPLEPALAESILRIGQFTPRPGCLEEDGLPLTWIRPVTEEGTVVTVSLSGGVFDLTISPSISTFDHHLGKRITASLYFELGAKYAEKVGGEIVQRATVIGCKSTEGAGLVIARYPSMPMSFERVCHGFQAVLLPGHHDLREAV